MKIGKQHEFTLADHVVADWVRTSETSDSFFFLMTRCVILVVGTNNKNFRLYTKLI